jgi:ribonuclease PH
MSSGRTHEIQRLIGRSLRAVVDLDALGDRTITLDCDVIQADGGTRTAAVSGSYVAMMEALERLRKQGVFAKVPTFDAIAAVSVGVVSGEPMLDLCYAEDSTASVDMNVVMTGKGEFVEVQATAEGMPFDRKRMSELLDLAGIGIRQLLDAQKRALAEIGL